MKSVFRDPYFDNSYFIQVNAELQVNMCGIAEAGSRAELNRSGCSNDCHTDIVKESVHNRQLPGDSDDDDFIHKLIYAANAIITFSPVSRQM